MDKTSVKNNGSSGISIALGVVLFIFILFLLFGTCTETGRSYFANVKTKLGGSGNLKELDIVMFMRPTCPWCKKMLEVIQKSGQMGNITVVDTSNPEGQAMAKQFGADKQPVPSFISRKNKTGTVGYRESIDKLVEALKPGQGPPNPPPRVNEGGENVDQGLLQQLQIVLFAREGCGYCTKAKEMLSQTGTTDAIRIVDITTPEGQSMAGELLPPGSSGVPAWVSLATKKSTIGFKPLDVILQELQ